MASRFCETRHTRGPRGNPLSSPPHPSPQFPPFRTVLRHVLASFPHTFRFFSSPFPTDPCFFDVFSHTPRLVSSLFELLNSPPQMPFEGTARVQALATLFDYGTEDENGQTHSQKRLAEGLGAYCLGVITRVYGTRGNRVARYLVKWDEGTSTSIEEQHLMLIGASQEISTSNADEESSKLSDHLTRDRESTDCERYRKREQCATDLAPKTRCKTEH